MVNIPIVLRSSEQGRHSHMQYLQMAPDTASNLGILCVMLVLVIQPAFAQVRFDRKPILGRELREGECIIRRVMKIIINDDYYTTT